MSETMKAIVIKQIVQDCTDKKQLEEGLKVEQVRRPVPSYNQVLIRVQRAQINPSDLAFIKGHYGKRGHTGEIPGFECAGTVVDHGASPFAWLLKGKRVATYTKSCWAEYVVVDANNCLVLNDSYSWESAAGAMINPLTVMLMLDTCAHEKVVVITAGTSDLAKRFVRAANTKGIKTIAIVGTESHVDMCQKNGAVAVLNSESQEFESHLTQLCHDNHVRMAFDLVGGETGSSVLSSLINGGEIYVLGMLSGQPIQPSLGDLVLEQKCVKGLFVNSVFDMNTFKLLKMKNDVAAMLDSELRGEIQATFHLEQIADAISTYTDDQAAGKVQLIIGDAEKVERIPSKQQERIDEERKVKEKQQMKAEKEVEEAYREQQQAQSLYEQQKERLEQTKEEYQQSQQQTQKDDIRIGGHRLESEEAYERQLKNPKELHREQRESQIEQHQQIEQQQQQKQQEQQQQEKKQQQQEKKQQQQEEKQKQRYDEQQQKQKQQYDEQQQKQKQQYDEQQQKQKQQYGEQQQQKSTERWEEQQESSETGEKQEQQVSGVGGRGGVQEERYTKSSSEHREHQQGQQ